MKITSQNGLRMAVVGLIAGLINGLLGVGGGTILIPAMVFFFGIEQHIAHGTSLAVILPTAIISTLIYQVNQNLDLQLAFQVAASGMIGGYIGAKLMEHIPSRHLKKIFGLFMIFAGMRMLL